VICPRCNIEHEVMEISPDLLGFHCPKISENPEKNIQIVSIKGHKQIPDFKRKFMVITRKAFDDTKQNFPHTVQSYSFCCRNAECVYRIGGLYYSSSKNELLWDANYDSDGPGVENFEGVPIRYCPWCQAEVVIINQPNILMVQSPVPSGHKPRVIKGGVGPNLFRLAVDGSLAPDPINGPQFFKWTGEIRGIKKGEWFISGGIPEAYMAVANDSTGKYHIAIPADTPEKILKVDGFTYQLVLRHEQNTSD
jgi:hypothetical protein